MTTVDDAINSRRSVRGFKSDPIPRATIEHILRIARRAPSGTNTQPWNVHVVTGTAKDALTENILKSYYAGEGKNPKRRLPFYLEKWRDPYLRRRRKVGWDMYGLVGIERGENEKMQAQHAENFKFFGAPVGLIFSIDDDCGWGHWLDYGMFLQNIMLAARGQGLHTCPQAAFASYQGIIRDALDLNENQEVVCGMSLGYEDLDAPINALRTEREELNEFVTFVED